MESLSPSFFCDTKCREIISKESKKISATKGTILFFQGDICPDILFLKSGTIRVYLQNEQCEEVTLYLLHAGEQCIVNTSSAISSSPAVGTAICESDIEGELLKSEAIKKLMIESKEYQEFMFGLFALRLSSLANLVEDIRFKTLEQRIINWLESKNSKYIKTTHENIALHLGSSRVVVSRILKRLESRGLLKLSRNKIEINFQK